MIPRKPLTIIRTAPGALVKGQFVPGIETEGTITASVQPITGEEMQVLRENEEATAAYHLYTNGDVDTVREQDGKQADRIKIDGITHIVIAVEEWKNSIIQHNKVTVVRKKTGQ